VLRDDSTVTVRPVKLSQQDEIQSVLDVGLQAGERVVTTGFARLTEGTAVTVSSAEDSGDAALSNQPRAEGTGGGRAEDTGQATPGSPRRRDGARGGRAMEKRNPRSGAPPATNP
jgi:multidrug efflux system membrane fusion protein